MSEAINQVLFPLKVIYLDDGSIVELKDLKEAASCLEFYNSDDPQDNEEILVIDRLRRRVRIIVEWLEVKVCELYSLEPISEEEISSLVNKEKKCNKNH